MCERFAITRGPGERLGRRKSAESGKTYPGAILPGPRIIAVNSQSLFITSSWSIAGTMVSDAECGELRLAAPGCALNVLSMIIFSRHILAMKHVGVCSHKSTGTRRKGSDLPAVRKVRCSAESVTGV